MERRFRFLALIVVFLAAGSLLLAQENPFVGTWKLNIEKSKFNPGPPPRSQSRTWDATGMVMVKGINADGTPMSYGYTIRPDGIEYPTVPSVPNGADKVVSRKIDSRTIESKFMKAGKHLVTTRYRISEDGKSVIITAVGDKDVVDFKNAVVWDRE